MYQLNFLRIVEGFAPSHRTLLLEPPGSAKPEMQMTEKDQATLISIAQRLQAIHEELRQLEKTTGSSGIQQAALSTAMALAWVDLVWNDTKPRERNWKAGGSG
jgi:hypothetical protein